MSVQISVNRKTSGKQKKGIQEQHYANRFGT